MVRKRLVHHNPVFHQPHGNGSSKLLFSRRAHRMVTIDNGEVWLSPKEAAQRLGLSVSRIYHIKNRLTHRKGNSIRSKVYFRESTLFEDYMNS